MVLQLHWFLLLSIALFCLWAEDFINNIFFLHRKKWLFLYAHLGIVVNQTNRYTPKIQLDRVVIQLLFNFIRGGLCVGEAGKQIR